MAHSFRAGSRGLELNPCRLFAVVSIASNGDATVVRGIGVKSVVHGTAGVYTVNLASRWQSLLDFSSTPMVASTGISAAPVIGLVSSDVSSATAPALVIQASAPHDSTTTTLEAKDPGDGEVLYIQIDVSNSDLL